MRLIKAIERAIVTDHTTPSHAHATAAGGAAADPLLPRSAPIAPGILGVKELFRGGSVPFEMVNYFLSLEMIDLPVYLQAGFFFPGKIFRFSVFVATTLHQRVAIDFLKVRLYL
jgi:hypothetical protein